MGQLVNTPSNTTLRRLRPAQLTTSQNDYEPPGLAKTDVLELAASTPVSITGLAGGFEGRVMGMCNVGAQTITIEGDSGSSAAANRFGLGGNYAIIGGGGMKLYYDGEDGRWRCVGSFEPQAAGPL